MIPIPGLHGHNDIEVLVPETVAYLYDGKTDDDDDDDCQYGKTRSPYKAFWFHLMILSLAFQVWILLTNYLLN